MIEAVFSSLAKNNEACQTPWAKKKKSLERADEIKDQNQSHQWSVCCHAKDRSAGPIVLLTFYSTNYLAWMHRCQVAFVIT